MSDSSSAPSEEHADMIVSREFREGNNSMGKFGELDRLLLPCPKCEKRIVKEFLSQHINSCQGEISDANKSSMEQKGVYTIDHFAVTPLTTATFPPLPPRGTLLVSVGCSSIKWKWRPPINDGGLPVFQYELRYLAKYSEFNPIISRYVKWEEQVPSLLTTHWCVRPTLRCAEVEDGPVCHFGFKMVGLRAATEYCNFQIRCHNLQGASEWVDMQPSGSPPVTTLEPEAPSEPLFFSCERSTASCMYVSWSPPFSDGGSEVVSYTIHYTVVEVAVTVTARGVIIDHPHKFSTGSADTSAVIRNIPSDSDVKDVFITATNKVKFLNVHGR